MQNSNHPNARKSQKNLIYGDLPTVKETIENTLKTIASSIDEFSPNQDLERKIVEKGEKDIMLQLQMMKKLRVNNIP